MKVRYPQRYCGWQAVSTGSANRRADSGANRGLILPAAISILIHNYVLGWVIDKASLSDGAYWPRLLHFVITSLGFSGPIIA